MNNSIGTVMAIILFIVLTTTLVGLLGFESSNETINSLIAYEAPTSRSGLGNAIGVVEGIFNFIGVFLALFTFSLPIPDVLNLIIVAPIAGGLLYIAVTILKDLVPLT